MSCHPLNVYTKFQIDISKHVEKSLENAFGRRDGQTDGRTDIAMAQYIIFFSNGHIKTNNDTYLMCNTLTKPRYMNVKNYSAISSM